ncbi:MAG TPA: hypothetical protein DCZ40_12355 [Lachnospiraceae bacterium]|nr:hypothetical protein [Lachnospiraceae bacterium]
MWSGSGATEEPVPGRADLPDKKMNRPKILPATLVKRPNKCYTKAGIRQYSNYRGIMVRERNMDI